MAPKRISVQKTCAPERTGPTVVLATNPRAKAGSDDIAAMLCCSKHNWVTFPQYSSLVSRLNRPSCASRLRSRSIATLPRCLAFSRSVLLASTLAPPAAPAQTPLPSPGRSVRRNTVAAARAWHRIAQATRSGSGGRGMSRRGSGVIYLRPQEGTRGPCPLVSVLGHPLKVLKK